MINSVTRCRRTVVRRVLYVDRLPYVEATILELLRYKTLIPAGVAHRTLRDTEVGGYFIPAMTTVSRCTVLHNR